MRSKNGDLDPSAARANDGDLTYCDRYQKLAARFSGLNCVADLGTGVVTCADPEELQLILKTLNAQHFNFILLGGTQLGAAAAEAFAGAGP